MIRPETDKTEVEAHIFRIIQSDCYTSLRRELDIDDQLYDIEMYDVRLIQGYPESKIKASTIPKKDGFTISKVVFFTESISDEINRGFSRVMNSAIFSEIVRIYVKFVLIHELVHVQQFKKGMSMVEYLSNDYESNDYERLANEKAVEILGREGEFQKEVVQMIVDRRFIVDNSMAEEFREKYLPYF